MSTDADYIARIDSLIEEGENLLLPHPPNRPGVGGFPTLNSALLTKWQTQTLVFLQSMLGPDHTYVQHFNENVIESPLCGSADVKVGIGILKAVREDLQSARFVVEPKSADPLSVIERLCDRFHSVARQLRFRHNNRTKIDVVDEYDVQYLIHALLLLYFDDVRDEAWTPSYAGKSSRMDFLLKRERIVIEIKKTRSGLGAKEIGSQLIEDIDRYKVHPDCNLLVCFVYDPEELVTNPRGIENDLNRDDGPMPVRVLIRPQ